MKARPRFVAVACIGGAIGISSALAGAATQPFTVSSSLAGKKVLAHRAHWVANPSLPEARISEVDFLIDGTLHWIEHHRPYIYGGLDGDNYLVTSWLKPGMHRFVVRAVGTDGRKVTATSVARVLPAQPAPAGLDSTRWTRQYSKSETGEAPAGLWILTIDRTGWRITDPAGGGNWIDVAYRSPGHLETRGGIWTRPHNTHEGNGWCEDTNEPVRFDWAVVGDSLTVTLAGPNRCNGLGEFLSKTWTRAS
jgi:hypothetical protein